MVRREVEVLVGVRGLTIDHDFSSSMHRPSQEYIDPGMSACR